MSVEKKIEAIREIMKTEEERWERTGKASREASISEMSNFAKHSFECLNKYEQLVRKEQREINSLALSNALDLSCALRFTEEEIDELDQEQEKDYRDAVRYLDYFIRSHSDFPGDSTVWKFLSGEISS